MCTRRHIICLSRCSALHHTPSSTSLPKAPDCLLTTDQHGIPLHCHWKSETSNLIRYPNRGLQSGAGFASLHIFVPLPTIDPLHTRTIETLHTISPTEPAHALGVRHRHGQASTSPRLLRCGHDAVWVGLAAALAGHGCFESHSARYSLPQYAVRQR